MLGLVHGSGNGLGHGLGLGHGVKAYVRAGAWVKTCFFLG